MYYVNDGTITVAKEHLEQVLDMIVKAGFYRCKDIISVDETADPVVIDIFEVYGDIEGDLTNFLNECKQEGITINGSISYRGDYDGEYIIENCELTSLTADECAIRNASDADLIEELCRRGSLPVENVKVIDMLKQMQIEAAKCVGFFAGHVTQAWVIENLLGKRITELGGEPYVIKDGKMEV